MVRFTVTTEATGGTSALALRRARSRSGLSIAEAAARLEISVMRYWLLESGEARLTPEAAWPLVIAEIERPRRLSG